MPRWPRSPFGRKRPSASDDHPPLSTDLTREELVDELREVIELFKAGRGQEGLTRLRPLAQAGDQDARYLLGAWYFEQGDMRASEPLLLGVAAEGRAEAMYLLGAICRGLHHDEETARRWFRAGGARGNADCMFEIGTCAIGDGDPGLAKFWLGRAAVAGNTNAMVNLGSLLLPEDPEGAQLWWGRAADKGNPVAIQIAGRTSEAAKGE